jgi:hypothetical protein
VGDIRSPLSRLVPAQGTALVNQNDSNWPNLN